ncbi:MAG: SNF2-related protein [Erysipelotrichaceae bacterium]|nr:MAG: SNF2-related protein [Erysipelotrichaceae bacterium]
MIVSIGDTLSLDLEINSLKSYQKNQLSIYGFKKSDNGYLYNGNSEIDIALKIYNYFHLENIDFELNDHYQQLILQKQSETNQFSELREKASKYKEAAFDNLEFKTFIDFCKSNLSRNLKQHQLKAAFHLYTLRNAANFSVPGSGKTSTVLAAYEKLRLSDIVNVLVVVGPPSSFTSWKNEFEFTLGRKPKVSILSGITKSQRRNEYFDVYTTDKLILMSFQTYANDHLLIEKYVSNENIKAFIVIDEAHYMKQVNGKWANAILKTGSQYIGRCVLTGTPCPRSYSDLFNLFDFVWGKDKAISAKEKIAVMSLEQKKEYANAGEIVRNSLDPFFYRVRKKELGLTEPVFNEPIMVQMNKYERRVYDSVFNRISQLVDFDQDKSFDILSKLKSARIIRLRQILSNSSMLKSALTSDERLFDNDDLNSIIINYKKIEIPAKITELITLVNEIRKVDKKILIWSNFIESIDSIIIALQDQGFGTLKLTGDTPVIDIIDSNLQTREKVINLFMDMDSGFDILVANPGACAESISLHKSCHNAIYYDLSYNCSQYLQSLDRIHRVGGSETIVSNYYFLQYAGTIDSDIHKNLIQKRDKMYNVIEYDSDIYSLDIDVFIDGDDDLTAFDRIFKK